MLAALGMEKLKEFSLPIKGLGVGEHHYRFKVGDGFYANFTDSPIEKGAIEVNVLFDKRNDMVVVDFSFSGTIETDCDRCLERIHLPIEGENRLFVKYGTELKEPTYGDDDADVVFISPFAHEFNLAPYIYEYTCLAIPLSKVYDCQADENAPCDETVLNLLDDMATSEEEEEEEGESDETKPTGDSPWDILRNLNKN